MMMAKIYGLDQAKPGDHLHCVVAIEQNKKEKGKNVISRVEIKECAQIYSYIGKSCFGGFKTTLGRKDSFHSSEAQGEWRKKERKRGKREREEWHPSPLPLIWSLKCEPSVLKSVTQ